MKKIKLKQKTKLRQKKHDIKNINYTIICNLDKEINYKENNRHNDEIRKNNREDEENIKNNEYNKKNEDRNFAEKLDEKILVQVNNLNYLLSRGKIIDLIELTGNPKRFLVKNFTSGIAKGIGAGIGFSIITALIIYLLQKIIKLNIPVISQYISDIIEIVEKTK